MGVKIKLDDTTWGELRRFVALSAHGDADALQLTMFDELNDDYHSPNALEATEIKEVS